MKCAKTRPERYRGRYFEGENSPCGPAMMLARGGRTSTLNQTADIGREDREASHAGCSGHWAKTAWPLSPPSWQVRATVLKLNISHRQEKPDMTGQATPTMMKTKMTMGHEELAGEKGNAKEMRKRKHSQRQTPPAAVIFFTHRCLELPPHLSPSSVVKSSPFPVLVRKDSSRGAARAQAAGIQDTRRQLIKYQPLPSPPRWKASHGTFCQDGPQRTAGGKVVSRWERRCTQTHVQRQEGRREGEGEGEEAGELRRASLPLAASLLTLPGGAKAKNGSVEGYCWTI